MKMTWFQHPACTTEEADELVKQYRRRGVKTERSLNHDCINWTVSALLRVVTSMTLWLRSSACAMTLAPMSTALTRTG
ncbi:hypothetical protein FI895_22850 [Salmonella enterica]|uniref:Phage protein n=1 Tax=Salmonella enterica TaxID=28901 RepID=A0A623EDH6_SALER|nr:hypothetical protein [Salmonella enterica]ECZ1425037.1 hypothetical protein [Salmonella enterica]